MTIVTCCIAVGPDTVLKSDWRPPYLQIGQICNSGRMQRRDDMFWTIFVFVVGWLVGRNWEQVKKFALEKFNANKNLTGKATRIDPD